MYDYPFWLREQQACHDDADIAYKVAMSLETDRSLLVSQK
jgi:hypothetical protein